MTRRINRGNLLSVKISSYMAINSNNLLDIVFITTTACQFPNEICYAFDDQLVAIDCKC